MTLAYPGVAYPGVTYPGVTSEASSSDTRPQDHLRVEVAFATEPDDAAPAWVDLTPRLDLTAGLSISRGRANEHEAPSPGKLSLVLDNVDGALTADRAASPYYPNVKVARRIRVTYRDPENFGLGNLLAAEDASFEGGTTGSWGTGYFGAPATVTLSNSTTHPASGTKGLLITWPTAAAGCGSQLSIRTTIGRRYTMKATVWVPAGSPAVTLGAPFESGTITGAASTVTGAAQTLTISWVAVSSETFIAITSNSATTAGQQCWVDAVMLDEGTTLGAFTTTAPVISYRFDGYVDEWPTEWPGGHDTYSRAMVTASDLLARIGSRRKLKSVVEETALLDDPAFYYTLGEPADSATVGDSTTGDNDSILSVRSVGTGGGLTFAAGTGPGTDGRAAPVFSPSGSNGSRITGNVPRVIYGPNGFHLSLEVAFSTSTVAEQTIVRWSDSFGAVYFELGISATGKLTGVSYSAWGGGVLQTLTSAATVTDGATHHAVLSISTPATTTTGTLILDGASAASGTFGAHGAFLVQLDIGGTQSGRLFTGTASHVAGYAQPLTVAQAGDHRIAQTYGFANERSDQRIARVVNWIGLPAERLVRDQCLSLMGHLDSTGMGALDYMRRIEATEGGLLYADGEGTLLFRSRSRKYTPKSPDLVLSEPNLLGRDTRITKDLQLVVNDVTGSRPGGATQRVTNEASIDSYGVQSVTLDLITNSDNEVTDAINWRAQTSAEPVIRIPSLTLDAYTDPTTGASIRDLALLDYVQVAGMPAQAHASTIDQVVQGYSEQINVRGWDVTLNTSNYSTARALILDHATYGKLDDANVLAY